MRQLTIEEKEEYREELFDGEEGSMFRQWGYALNKLRRERNELDPMDIWHESTLCIEKLRKQNAHRNDLVPFVFNWVLEDCARLGSEKKSSVLRTHDEALETAKLVMTVTAIRLVNHIERGHENDSLSEEDDIASVIIETIGDSAFDYYHELFNEHNVDGRGNKIVIDPYNPLAESSVDNSIQFKKESDKDKIISLLQDHLRPLDDLFGDNTYQSLFSCFEKVCDDAALLKRFMNIRPNNNEWQMNKVMALNIVAIFVKLKRIDTNPNQLNKKIGGKNNYTYLVGDKPDGSDRKSYALTQRQYDQVEEIIKKL